MVSPRPRGEADFMDVAAGIDTSVQPPRTARRLWLAPLLLALLVVSGALAYWALTRPSAATYTTAVVSTGTITKTVSASGTVNPVLTITVGTYVSGVIQKLYCDFNTQVKAGQICAKIDPRPYQV